DGPFEKVVEELRPERQPGRNPLFDVMLVLQNTPAVKSSVRGLRLEPWKVENGTAKFDLTWEVEEIDGALEVRAEYNRDVCASASIQRLLQQFVRMLEAMVGDPGQRLSAVQLMSAEERRQVLVEWNATEVDYPRDKCIHELFEEQADRTPAAVAVVHEDRE